MADARRLADTAAEAASTGRLARALAISKAIVELDPGHGETQAALAELYARPAGATAAPRPLAPEPTEIVSLAAHEVPVTAFARIQLAAREAIAAGVEEEVVIDVDAADEVTGEWVLPTATSTSTPTATSTRLPRVPLFSDLSRGAFLALTRAMALRRVSEGEVVLREGEAGTSFYVVAGGRLAVSKRDDRGHAVVVAHLGEGDFFGEMALLSGAPRAATVAAETAAELLELGADALLGVAREHPHLAASLRRFYRQRLLANAMALSAVFRPFPRGDRKLIMERFLAREVAEGETVIREGEPSDGLYVVLDGTVEIVKRKDARTVVVGLLREGDVFGERSCLRKAPASATAVVRRGGTLLKLPRKDFDDVVVSYPRILELVADLSEERADRLDAILSGRAQWTEDGLVLV